jgi:hypothetical protein
MSFHSEKRNIAEFVAQSLLNIVDFRVTLVMFCGLFMTACSNLWFTQMTDF